MSLSACFSFGEESVCIVCGDQPNSFWRETFNIGDVATWQDDVSGLIPHLADKRQIKHVCTCGAVSQYDDDFKAFKTYMLVKPEGRRVGLKTNVLQWDLLD